MSDYWRDSCQLLQQEVSRLAALNTSLRQQIDELERERDEARRERDAALALLAEAWEWTTPRVCGKLGYVALHERVKAALQAKEEPAVGL